MFYYSSDRAVQKTNWNTGGGSPVTRLNLPRSRQSREREREIQKANSNHKTVSTVAKDETSAAITSLDTAGAFENAVALTSDTKLSELEQYKL